LPVVYLTAFHILHHVACLRPGLKVLIQMAAGGVGMAAIQLCRLVDGVELFGTSSAAKHALLREAGVQHPIDYRRTDYAEEVRRITQGRGVDLILDPVGPRSWRKGYPLLAPGGHLVMFGMSELTPGSTRSWLTVGRGFLSLRSFAPLKLMSDNRTVSGVNMLPLLGDQRLLQGSLGALLSLYQQGKIAPPVDRVFPLAQAAEAHRYVQEHKNFGKVLFDCA
jgi:synaptic vesicle membrane protein VAT-1